jgi:hypothetical protein
MTQKYIEGKAENSKDWTWMKPDKQNELSKEFKAIKDKYPKLKFSNDNVEDLKDKMSTKDYEVVSRFYKTKVGYTANYSEFFTGDNKAITIDVDATLNFSDKMMSENISHKPNKGITGVFK